MPALFNPVLAGTTSRHLVFTRTKERPVASSASSRRLSAFVRNQIVARSRGCTVGPSTAPETSPVNLQALLIDDDIELAEATREVCGLYSIDCDVVHDGTEGLRRAAERRYDVVVLDVMLPGLDGFSVLTELRKTSGVPVIMLTARGAGEDRVRGLELGADDYLPKPFHGRELVARIRAVARRATARPESPGRLAVGAIAIDPSARAVYRHDEEIAMTTLEFDVLHQLMKSAGAAVTRDDFARHLYGREASAFDRSIDNHVMNLRDKLGRDAIVTVRGVGYMLPLVSGNDG